MTWTDAMDRALEESCICEDPFGSGGYITACKAHGMHRDIETRLNGQEVSSQLAAALYSALSQILQMHFRHPAPGPVAPNNGLCSVCGGTGKVYLGTGEDGHIWSDDDCGCDVPYCGGCGEFWPCEPMRIAAEAIDKLPMLSLGGAS